MKVVSRPPHFRKKKKLENKSWCLFTFYGPLIYMKTFLGQEKHTWPQKIHWRQKQKDARKIAAAAALLASLKKIAMRCVEKEQKRGLHLTRVFIKAPYYFFITSTINILKRMWWNSIIRWALSNLKRKLKTKHFKVVLKLNRFQMWALLVNVRKEQCALLTS